MLPKNGRTILLGEDDLEVRSYLETALRCQGYAVESARDGEEVLACLHDSGPAVSAVVLDVIMPRRDGLSALREIRRSHPDLPVVMISGAASSFKVVEAIKNGANDFIPKPIEPEHLRKALTQAFDATAASAKPADAPTPKTHIFFGNSRCMREIQRLIGRVGSSDAPVLIQGETGAGKEVLARELHAQSPRAKKPILKLNCAALPSELVESELFGYERGAFTGAFQKKLGLFELADGGAILLDEIGDMDVRLQAKLLQVLQDQSFQRLGGRETVKVDVRVIAATHRDLRKAIAADLFREDLYYRLNVIKISLPPLRERKEDILPLAEVLLQKHCPAGAAPMVLPESTRRMFLEYDWPGNIRELENVIRKFVVLGDEWMIEEDLRTAVEPAAPIASRPAARCSVRESSEINLDLATLDEAPSTAEADVPVLDRVANATRNAERVAIMTALKRTNWNRRQAAVMLQIDYKALLYKMKKLSIRKEKAPPPRFNGTALASASACVAS